MKNKICLTVLLAAFFAGQVQSQTVRRVSNALGAGAPYTTIQAALTAASNGDIILVEGSPTNYAGATISVTKQVTIQGPGYFLDQNNGLQVNLNDASAVSIISFDAGSAGSVIRGMKTSSITINTSNITVTNNYIVGGIDCNTGSNNIVISGNYLTGIIRSFSNMTNLLIANNYAGGGISFSLSVTTLAVVTNNVIAAGGTNYYLQNSTIENNIFLTAGTAIGETLNSTIKNNVFVSASQTNADATNVFGATVAALFVGLPGNTTDTQWKLKPGSPALGAGVGGTDCGMYAGINPPYRISGIATGQPTITNFTAPGTVPANGTLNVKVSAKVN
jgi:hypothetical protein